MNVDLCSLKGHKPQVLLNQGDYFQHIWCTGGVFLPMQDGVCVTDSKTNDIIYAPSKNKTCQQWQQWSSVSLRNKLQ